jgi:hypothetical protein
MAPISMARISCFCRLLLLLLLLLLKAILLLLDDNDDVGEVIVVVVEVEVGSPAEELLLSNEKTPGRGFLLLEKFESP